MYRLLRQRGIEPRLCEAFVYGGGNMFPGLFTRRHVGDDNVRWALDALAHDGIARAACTTTAARTYRRLAWTVGPDAAAGHGGAGLNQEASTMPIKVYVVDDSAVVRQTLMHLLQGDPEIELHGQRAQPAAGRARPSARTGPTCCCSTSRCPAWTA